MYVGLRTIPMRESSVLPEQSYLVEETGPVADSTSRLKKILDAKYEKTNLPEIVESSIHLKDDQKIKLKELLVKYETLFDGTLGQWKGPPVNIELREGVTPFHAKPYPIPKSREKQLRMEVERLCQEKVLKKTNRSEWAAPNFAIPKSDGTIRFLTDFRELNKRIKRKPYPIPKIQDLLLKLEALNGQPV